MLQGVFMKLHLINKLYHLKLVVLIALMLAWVNVLAANAANTAGATLSTDLSGGGATAQYPQGVGGYASSPASFGRMTQFCSEDAMTGAMQCAHQSTTSPDYGSNQSCSEDKATGMLRCVPTDSLTAPSSSRVYPVSPESSVDNISPIEPEGATSGRVVKKKDVVRPDGDPKAELSSIEQLMLTSPSGADKIFSQSFKVSVIQQFGYSFFKPEARGFAPITDIPVGPEYVLGSGDRIVVSVWGSLNGTFELEVNRSGEVSLPKVGPVKVAGVPLGRLHSLFSGSLAKIYKDFNISVTMGKLRLIKVYLVGEIRNPGDYTISSLSTVINALSAAGGPTKNGTLRSITIKRDGKTAATVDLYDFFIKGDKSSDIRLQSGDTIFVPPVGPVAGIVGNVRRPAIYELRDEKTLNELVVLAGGITSTGYLQRLQLARVDAHDKKIVTDINIDPKSSGKSLEDASGAIGIQDMDLVKIFPIDSKLRGYVRLEGHLLRPGDYSLRPGMRISDLIREDNLLPEYYSETGQITRLFRPDNHPEVVNFNLKTALAGDRGADLELKEFDRVRVFSRWEMEDQPKVRIGGEIQRPGEYRLLQNMTLRDLLIVAGNPKQTAFMKNAEVTRLSRSGDSVSSFSINVNLEEALKGGAKDNILLQPYDEVVVRKIPNWSESRERYITLKGEVAFPGVYPIFKGEKLSRILRRAGGFTDKAYLPGAKFTREQIKEYQQKRMDEILAREEINITKKQGELAAVAASREELEATKASLEGMMKSLAILKQAKAEGRLVINLPPMDRLENSPFNLEVMGGDTLEIPSDPKVVNVFGQVYNPSSFVYVEGETVADYLAKSGGGTREAENADIYILKADGTVVSRQMASTGFFFGGFMNKPLEPGDTVVVPQKLEKIAWMREIKDVATILGQIALTAGVLIAAGL